MYGVYTFCFILCWVLAGGAASLLITGSIVSALAAMLAICGFSWTVIAAFVWYEDRRDRGR